MKEKLLSELLRAAPEAVVQGGDPPIRDLVYDSRQARRGSLFFALEGVHTDGEKYISDAVAAGAAAVLARREAPPSFDGAAYVRVPDPRAAMSRISAAMFDHPASRLKIVGVTGTDGKSSTAYFIHQLLEAAGKKSGLLSTVSFLSADTLEKNPYRQSTPEAPIIHRALREMLDNGKEYAVVEATSHGLSDRTMRLRDVDFDAAVLTNVTHEHLEFHGTWENYLSDKTNLFRRLSIPRSAIKGCPAFGVANADDRSWDFVRRETPVPLVSYAVLAPEADLRATDLRPDMTGTDFLLHDGKGRAPVRISLPGAFNVENVLAAAAAVGRLLGVSAVDLVPALEALRGVRGRMSLVDRGQPFTVLVDYAHTPGSFARLFPMVRQYTPGKVIAVFGSGGERDREKRPIQGEIAARYSGLVILADEDPRGEDPRALLEEIAAGCPGLRRGEELLIIPDRREAIREAYRRARPGDTVLLLGKGHEASIIGRDGPVPWDEIRVAAEILEETE